MPRPRKSDSEKAAKGTLQPCRQRQVNASSFELTMDPPVGLTKDAREAWKLAVMCAPKGNLTALDFTVLERWARNYAFYRKLQKDLDHNGLVIYYTDADGTQQTMTNPAFNACIKVQQVLAACEKELGFTPCSRARVSGVTKEETEQDEFASFS